MAVVTIMLDLDEANEVRDAVELTLELTKDQHQGMSPDHESWPKIGRSVLTLESALRKMS